MRWRAACPACRQRWMPLPKALRLPCCGWTSGGRGAAQSGGNGKAGRPARRERRRAPTRSNPPSTPRGGPKLEVWWWLGVWVVGGLPGVGAFSLWAAAHFPCGTFSLWNISLVGGQQNPRPPLVARLPHPLLIHPPSHFYHNYTSITLFGTKKKSKYTHQWIKK